MKIRAAYGAMGDVDNGIFGCSDGRLGYRAELDGLCAGPKSCSHLLGRMRFICGSADWPLEGVNIVCLSSGCPTHSATFDMVNFGSLMIVKERRSGRVVCSGKSSLNGSLQTLAVVRSLYMISRDPPRPSAPRITPMCCHNDVLIDLTITYLARRPWS